MNLAFYSDIDTYSTGFTTW